MIFCKLPDGQKAALLFIESILAAPADSKIAPLKTAINNQNWSTLATIAALVSNPAPSESDFQAVGTLPPGVQNAFFVLALVDASGTPDAKDELEQALATHCYDRVAGAIVESISKTGVQFTGDDLRQAYAPGDHESCQGPGDFEKFIGDLILGGQLVGNFFSQSLPDFFEHDFANVFSQAIPDFFTGDFANFFKNFGESLASGFEGFGDTLGDGLKDLGGKLDPSHW